MRSGHLRSFQLCFERIHRSNLAGMGVLPLQFAPAAGGTKKTFTATLCLDTPNEVDYYGER